MNRSLIVIVFILILGVVFILPSQMMTAQAATKDDFEYTINADGTSVTITDYKGTNQIITIPAKLNGLNVTSVSGFQYNNII